MKKLKVFFAAMAFAFAAVVPLFAETSQIVVLHTNDHQN